MMFMMVEAYRAVGQTDQADQAVQRIVATSRARPPAGR